MVDEVDSADLFEASQASEYIQDTSAFGAAKGVVSYLSPATIKANEGLGKNNPIKKSDGEYVFPSDFEAWQIEMLTAINNALAAGVGPSSVAAEAARDAALVAQTGAEAALAATQGIDTSATASAARAEEWAVSNTAITGEPAGTKSSKAWAEEAESSALTVQPLLASCYVSSTGSMFGENTGVISVVRDSVGSYTVTLAAAPPFGSKIFLTPDLNTEGPAGPIMQVSYEWDYTATIHVYVVTYNAATLWAGALMDYAFSLLIHQ